MNLDYQIILAVCLDLAVGDPRWLPHPVRFIGEYASWLETPTRRLVPGLRLAGITTVFLVLSATALVSVVLVYGGAAVTPALGVLMSIILMYTGIAGRDLILHSRSVQVAVQNRDLSAAAAGVGMICGRDTDRLDEDGIIRATVESVAENTVDGVTAPLFYAVILGPVGLMLYKAINTLDSTFGYRNERYELFGWASAKLDDLANYIPSRITGLLVPVAAFLLGLRWQDSYRVFLRDRGKHPSPNAGQTEAAFAGALGLQLGGLSYYGGNASEKPKLGDPVNRPVFYHIRYANLLMIVTSALFLLLALGVRSLFVCC